MKIIISPAKKMEVNTELLPVLSQPAHLEKANHIKEVLMQYSYEELKSIWKCNDSIAEQNYTRLKEMDLNRNLTPALIAYQGIQYQYMAPTVLEQTHYSYLQEHLYIMSGFYGLLRPFDGIVPYRLEMQAKLPVDTSKNLYEYWSDELCNQIVHESNLILNLASKEYSKCIEAYLPKETTFITAIFGEIIDGKVKEKGTYAKMARGEMVRFAAENQVTQLEQLKKFNRLGYHYSEEHSTDTTFVYIKGETSC
ncbi:hypothetical protein lbkm_1057 [Lachnospiraceae bacterium KM106-2]|nr:hypothetical protein lbkm_1057 [Lachnospiraceae bacterium KM106-2]